MPGIDRAFVDSLKGYRTLRKPIRVTARDLQRYARKAPTMQTPTDRIALLNAEIRRLKEAQHEDHRVHKLIDDAFGRIQDSSLIGPVFDQMGMTNEEGARMRTVLEIIIRGSTKMLAILPAPVAKKPKAARKKRKA